MSETPVIEIERLRKYYRDEEAGNYTLTWGKYGGADGYVVVESDTEFTASTPPPPGPS